RAKRGGTVSRFRGSTAPLSANHRQETKFVRWRYVPCQCSRSAFPNAIARAAPATRDVTRRVRPAVRFMLGLLLLQFSCAVARLSVLRSWAFLSVVPCGRRPLLRL